MVSGAAPRWNPIEQWQRMRRMIREPADIVLTLRLAYFIWRVPEWLNRMPLPQLLQRFDAAHQRAFDADASLERIGRLSRVWFRTPFLSHHNTCYVRALMFYRFLDSSGTRMQIHFLVEPARTQGDRLRGHAWVTIGQTMIEPPPPDVVARSRGIYTYPPET